MRSLKRLLILFSLMLALGALVACGGTAPESAEEPETTTSESEEEMAEEEMEEEDHSEEEMAEEEMEEEAMADAVELRMTWYTDGNEDVVIREILDQFEAENPDIKVVVDNVAYQSGILENLPIQLAAGEGPDLARVTNLGGLSEYYLDISPYVDTAYWEESFGPFLNWTRPSGDTSGIYGMMTQLTVTGPYINKTLFDQAGVEVPTGDVTWEEWADLTQQVADATGTDFAMAMDRTGHRFAGPAISQGAGYFNADGYPAIDDEGFRAMSQLLIDWHEDGTMPIDVWASSSGAYVPANDLFVNGQVVLYMSGSWQIGQFANTIGDAFDWQVIPNPCGPGACSGMPGGAALVPIKDTDHPEEVARVMDYLAQADVLEQFSAKTLFIPGHLGLAESGVAYETDIEAASGALSTFVEQVGKLDQTAFDLQAYPYNFSIFNASRDRLTQVILGELTLDEAVPRMQDDIDQAIFEASGGELGAAAADEPEEEAEMGEPVELRMTWYTDGNEDVVMRDLLDRFEAENPNITVVMDTVAYQSGILENLPIQLAAGEGPDLARVTNLGGLSEYYLDISPYVNTAYWEDNFGPFLNWVRPAGDTSGIYGMMTQLTVTGPYINKTLFDQAGVEVPTGDVTWEEWADLTQQVADATGTDFAMAMDRTGHRFAGPAISQGAGYFDADGNPALDDEGFRAMAQLLVDWHDDGTMPIDVWASSSGAYVPANDLFVNGQVVLYMSGSWQIGQFANSIGDAFDWQVIPNPCGPGACSGMPGGAALVPIKDTEHPEEVAMLMDFLAQEEILGEFSARTLFIPGHLGLSSSGVAYETDLEAASNALSTFVGQVGKLDQTAFDLQAYPFNFSIFNASRDRITQVILDELTLDEAMERIQEDVDQAIAEAGG